MADLGNRPSQTAAVDCPGVAHFTRGGRGLLRTSSHPQLDLRSTGLSNWVGSGGLGEEPVESYGGCLEVQGGSGPLVEGVGDGA